MDRIVYRLTLDATKGGIQKILQGFNTGEDLARRIVVNLVANGKPLTLDERYVASMYVTKPNMNIPCINECVIEENQIIYDVPGTDIDAEGIVKMKLKVIDDDMVLMSPTFALEVLESEADDTDATNTPTYTALEKALLKANEVYNGRMTSFTLEADGLLRVNYADGTSYESDVIAEFFSKMEENEDGRILAEESRVLAEQKREDAEDEREDAEAKRKTSFASMLADFDTFCNRIDYVDGVLYLKHDDEVLHSILLASGEVVTIDSALSATSPNAIANMAVAKKFAEVLTTVQTQIDTTVANIQTTSKATLSQTGWYRVAEYNVSGEQSYSYILKGADAQSCELTIKRQYNATSNEWHKLLLSVAYNDITFEALSNKSNTQFVTKVRYTYNTTERKAFIEVYYSGTTAEPTLFTINSAVGGSGKAWQAITPTLTSETVDGVTVTTTYDIHANASPVTDLDLAQVDGSSELSTSILEKAQESGVGVYYYRLSGNKYTGEDLPAGSYTYAVARIEKRTSSSAVVTISGLYSSNNKLSPPIFNMYNGTSWSGWNTFATTADLANYFKNTGGDINGNISLRSNGTDNRVVELLNSLRRVSLSVNPSGVMYLWDGTNSKEIIKSTADGTNTFNGTASGNLPLSGGTLTGDLKLTDGSTTNTIAVFTSGNTFYVRNRTDSNNVVDLQLPKSGDAIIYKQVNGVSSAYPLLHAGNYTSYAFAKTGGSITGSVKIDYTDIVPLSLENKSGTTAYIAFSNKNGLMGMLGFGEKNLPVFYDGDWTTRYDLLHTGNSAKVAIQETAPSDTSALWVW